MGIRSILGSARRRLSIAIAVGSSGLCLFVAQGASAETTTFPPDPNAWWQTTTFGEGAGPHHPYPSTIEVSGLDGAAADVDVNVQELISNCHPDLDLLLVGPGGQRTMLLSDSAICGGSPHGLGPFLTFDDEAPGPYPGCEHKGATYKPTDDACEPEIDQLPPPAPPAPYPLSLSVFDGTNPNGTWGLYVFDDGAANPYTSAVAGGWRLTITAPDNGNGGVSCDGVRATLVGTARSDELEGTGGRDVIQGRGGDDELSGLGGDDLVCGGKGGDRILGKGGGDTLIGQRGRDVLVGGKGRDRLFGHARRSSGKGKSRDRCPKSGRDKRRDCVKG